MFKGRLNLRAVGCKTKYNTEGFAEKATFTGLGVSERYAHLLSNTCNLALAHNTKSQYKTAVKHMERIEKDLSIDMSLPFTIAKTLNYVGYLMDERGCSSSTISQYLSGVRMLHLCRGFDADSLRPPIVNMILKGRTHWDNVQKTLQNKPRRLPVTIKVLKYLKQAIHEREWSTEKKLRLWCICCLMWNGSLRVHEVLSKSKDEFDPITTLTMNDVEILAPGETPEVSILRIHLKSPKERRIGNGVKLEIFENKTFCCPVRAWNKWKKNVVLKAVNPVFMEGGRCFTGQDFNKILTELTNPLTNGTDGIIRPHSFRSGVASEMGQRGFSDSEIQAQGRWTSQAFKVYMKLERVKRLKFTSRIADMINDKRS